MRFVREIFAVEPDQWQQEVLNAVAAGERWISIRSGHRVGKTTLLAWLTVWHILTKFPQKTICTAPTTGQLEDALLAETVAHVDKLPPALRQLLNVKSDAIELVAAPAESFVTYAVSRAETPEALAGKHSENLLLIADEASGVPEAVYEASLGSMAAKNARMALAGNPVRSSGYFYDTHHKMREHWKTWRVSSADCSRTDPDWVANMAAKYGERSNAYRVRVLGEFPLADDDTVIPFELMETALKRDVQPTNVREIWGLDCARFGSDDSALARRKGNVLVEPVQSWHGLDTMELCGRIKAKWDVTPTHERPEDICVDAIGLGAGVADRLREMGLPARAINVSESPSLGDQYRNLRAELWFKCRQWLANRDVNLAGDEALGAQLIAPKYKHTSTGKTQVESKDEMKKRGMRSPDKADAFVLTFAVDAVSATHGDSLRTSWKEPLRRVIKGLV